MKKTGNEKGVSGIESFGRIAALFAVLTGVILLAALSALTYRNVLAGRNEARELRCTLSYLKTGVRSHDTVGGVRLEQDGKVLVLTETDGAEVYEERIYCYNGRLLEEYTVPGWATSPEDAVVLAETSFFHGEDLGNGLLKLETDEGSVLIRLFAGGVR